MRSRLLRCVHAAAAVEMALLTPIFVVLLLGSLELGHYYYQEHKLVQSVRDAARWAARQSFSEFPACGSILASTDPIASQSMQIARTGQPSGGTDRLPNWTNASTTFVVTTNCATTGGGQTYVGIYNGSASGARLVQIEASLPYSSMFGLRTLQIAGLRLRAQQQAAVTGI